MPVPAPQVPPSQQTTSVFVCPSQEQLRHLLAEKLPQAERAAVEVHIEQCRQCQQMLEALTEDSVVHPRAQVNSSGQLGLLGLRKGHSEQPAPAPPDAQVRGESPILTPDGPEGTPLLPPALAEWIDRICDDFESAWKAARTDGPSVREPPSLEDYLAQAPESSLETSALLHELIQLDIYYRASQGEELCPDDYRARFPALDRVLLTQAPAKHAPGNPHPAGPPRRASSRAQTPVRPPTIPGYELLEELGRGGMGVVYKARHLALNRIVALKMILHTKHARPEDRVRFRAEAEAVAQLQHPHIVQIYEIGDHDGMPFFSLEFCSGGPLTRKLRDIPLPPRESAELTQTLARAMQAVHEVRVIHRDLKPDNILLTVDGTPKITDFGLAKRLDQPGQTQTGVILGTPSYMAPEQAGGKNADLSPRTDVYALAAILYEMLTGRPPFKAATVWETRTQVLTVEPVPPRRLQPQVPADLETVCLKGLQKDPRRRYASAAELADDLARFLRGEPIRARPVPVWERVLRWARRQPAAAALFVAVFLALVVRCLAPPFTPCTRTR